VTWGTVSVVRAESHVVFRTVVLGLTVVSGLYLLAVLSVGYAFVTTDWSGLGCLDREEVPACMDGGSGAGTLADIRTSSWVVAAVSILCVGGSGLVSLMARRARYLAAAATLCVLSLAAAGVLWSRVY
jgi:hypothetical protein